MITCPKCATKVPKENLKPDRGFTNDLQRILIICWFCDWSGLLKDYTVNSRFFFCKTSACFYFQGHLVQKHPNPICSYCDQCFSNVPDFDQHQLYHCEKMSVFCPLKPLGCEEMVSKGLNSYLYPMTVFSRWHALLYLNIIEVNNIKSH